MPKKITPLYRPVVFNTIFNDPKNIDLLEELIAILFQRDLKDIKGKAKLLTNNNNPDFATKVDITADVEGELFNIKIVQD